MFTAEVQFVADTFGKYHSLGKKSKACFGAFWGAIFMIVRILFLMKMREGVPVIY